MQHEKIPFFLVTGFLGSGKTTFLKHFLSQYSGQKKIAVVQNEFAPASVDGTELKSGDKDFEILEINQGSVFCVCLLSEFVKSLVKFADIHSPDAILMEASGLSDPIAIAEMFQQGPLKERFFISKIWTVVDAPHFLKAHKFTTRIDHQVRISDIVVINKTDLLQDPDELNTLETEIKKINPFAGVQNSRFCTVNIENLFTPLCSIPVAEKCADKNASRQPSGRPDLDIAVLKTGRKISKDKLDQFIHEFLPTTYRIKGFVNISQNGVVAVQTVFNKYDTKEIENYTDMTQLIAMGENLNATGFSKKFNSYCD